MKMKNFNPPDNMCCDDVISCIFDLNYLDIKVYKELIKMGEIRADILAKKLNKDRSTIYRSLQKLVKCGVCIKKTNKIISGGYYHTYLCKDIKLLKKNIESCIDNWYKRMKETIKMLDI